MKRILITGAAGKIGSLLRKGAARLRRPKLAPDSPRLEFQVRWPLRCRATLRKRSRSGSPLTLRTNTA
jgi:hypothetical protein